MDKKNSGGGGISVAVVALIGIIAVFVALLRK